MSVNLTTIILAKNEEKSLADCINSCKFSEEIIVVDDYSSDTSASIARKHGARVIKRKLEGDFSAQRNFGLKEASGKWVLFVDADERVSPELAGEIMQIVKDLSVEKTGYFIKRQDSIFGKWILAGENGEVKLLRLARKTAGKWERAIHETWNVLGRIGSLHNPLWHYPHATLHEFIDKINYYSDIHAKENCREGKRSSLAIITFFPVLKFLNTFFIKRGFLDGLVGFVLAMMMSLHSFLSWSKLWILQKRK